MVFDFGSLRIFMKGFKKRVLGRLGGWSVDREEGLCYLFFFENLCFQMESAVMMLFCGLEFMIWVSHPESD
jgi:hypothetical protein